jgi:DNA-binding winged helix-turn-helix (wHTH) protein
MNDVFDGLLRFDRFELDVPRRELSSHGIRIPIQLNPSKLLGYLALHSGETVSREDLRLLLWNQDTFVDFEAGLNFCIRQIRKVLGEDARNPRFIETQNRRGYRFIAPVERVCRSKTMGYSGTVGVNMILRLPRILPQDRRQLELLAKEITQLLVTSYSDREGQHNVASSDACVRSPAGVPRMVRSIPSDTAGDERVEVHIRRNREGGLHLALV